MIYWPWTAYGGRGQACVDRVHVECWSFPPLQRTCRRLRRANLSRSPSSHSPPDECSAALQQQRQQVIYTSLVSLAVLWIMPTPGNSYFITWQNNYTVVISSITWHRCINSRPRNCTWRSSLRWPSYCCYPIRDILLQPINSKLSSLHSEYDLSYRPTFSRMASSSGMLESSALMVCEKNA